MVLRPGRVLIQAALALRGEGIGGGAGPPVREGPPHYSFGSELRGCLLEGSAVYQSPAGAANVPAVPMKNEEQLL
jgi:hypothetical protein